MIGRGMIANPTLLDQILGDTQDIDKKKLKDFQQELIKNDYKGLVSSNEKPYAK